MRVRPGRLRARLWTFRRRATGRGRNGRSWARLFPRSNDEPFFVFDETGIEANPRLVVASLNADARDARALHEDLHRRRGDGENRIEECRLDPFADRTSTRTMRADPLRPRFAFMACALLRALRRIGLPHTRFADTCATIRLKPLETGAQVTTGVRRLEVATTSARPRRRERALAHERLFTAAA